MTIPYDNFIIASEAGAYEVNFRTQVLTHITFHGRGKFMDNTPDQEWLSENQHIAVPKDPETEQYSMSIQEFAIEHFRKRGMDYFVRREKVILLYEKSAENWIGENLSK